MIERSPELEELTRTLYDAVSNADAAFFARHLSRSASCVVIGTGPGEWWDDYESALGAIKDQMDAAGASIRLVPGDLRAYRAGNVGWVADRPTFRVGEVAAECRHTSVFVHRDGDWHMVQHHFSIAVPNQQVFGPSALPG